MPDAPSADPPAPPQPPATPAAPPDEPKTFTQDEVNRIVKERADRMIRQQFGDIDPTDAIRKAKEFDQLQAANQTELEKAQSAAQKAAGDSQWLAAVLYASQLESAIVQAAIGKFTNPRLAPRIVDQAGIDPTDTESITKAIDKAVEENPELATGRTPAPPSFDGGPRTPAPSGEDMNDLLRKAAGRA